MRQLVQKIKPKHGYSSILHLLLTIVLPLTLYVLVRVDLRIIAVAVLLLSKWRMLAVRPRFWPANIQGNAIDIFVGLSVISFMSVHETAAWQIYWAGFHAIWLVAIKPRSSILWNSLQALVGQTTALFALYLQLGKLSIVWLILAHWVICYYAARHFFSSFAENHSRFLAFMWAYFCASLAWLLGHWQIYYGIVAQPTLVITVLGFGLSGIYYFDHFDRLSKWARREMVFIMVAVVSIILVFSDWADQVTR